MTKELDTVTNDMGAMMRLAVDKGEDGVAALERLVAMQERAQDRAAAQSFAAAMRAVQESATRVVKDRANEQTKSRYAAYSTIAKALKPVYTAQGFSLMFGEGEAAREGDIRTIVDVMHVDGHIVQRFIDFPVDDRGIAGKANKTAIHGKASTFSYAERYLTVMIFCPDIVDEDDDGGAGMRDVETISEDQVITLAALLTEVISADEKMSNDPARFEERFLHSLQIARFEDLAVSRYHEAVNSLERKRKQAA